MDGGNCGVLPVLGNITSLKGEVVVVVVVTVVVVVVVVVVIVVVVVVIVVVVVVVVIAWKKRSRLEGQSNSTTRTGSRKSLTVDWSKLSV